MAAGGIDVDDSAFRAALGPAFDEWRNQAFAVGEVVADRVVALAKGFVPKGVSLRLEASIRRDPLVRTGPDTGYIAVHAGGPGIREAIPMEIGTYKDRPRAYMRKAFAVAIGGAAGAGFSARVIATSKGQAIRRRAARRAKLRVAVRKRLLTSAEARRESRRISSSRRLRG